MRAPRTTTVSVPDAGSYELDPRRSLVEFGTRHVFGLALVRGTFGIVSGRIDVADPPTASRVEATASVSSFDTGNPKRDDHVRSQDFLDEANHPHLVFRSTSLERNGDSWALHGTLTARGQDAPLVMHVIEVRQDESGALALRATATVDRFAHGVVAMKAMAGRRLKLSLTAHAVRVMGS